MPCGFALAAARVCDVVRHGEGGLTDGALHGNLPPAHRKRGGVMRTHARLYNIYNKINKLQPYLQSFTTVPCNINRLRASVMVANASISLKC